MTCTITGRHCVSTQRKLEVVTLFNLVNRLEEEERLIYQEMTNFLRFFKDIIPGKLNNQLKGIVLCLEHSTPLHN